MNHTSPTQQTLQRVYGYIAAHPGVQHSRMICSLAEDREGQIRIRSAITLLLARGFIVKTTTKRPHRYVVK